MATQKYSDGHGEQLVRLFVYPFSKVYNMEMDVAMMEWISW